jgi:site-specific DNA recombinase
MTDNSTIAASYERVSTRAQGQHGFSLGAQHQSLEDFTQAQGWLLPEHLRFRDGEDAAASGADWDLPDLNRMLEAARSRAFTVLVVPDFDRFARSMVKGLVLEEQLKKLGVRVVFQRVPVEDTPEGQLLKNQLYGFAEYDRMKITLRTMMGRRAKAQTGKVVGVGRPPYGYGFTYETLTNGKRRVCGLEPDPETAHIAQRILTDLRTRSTIDVAEDLNREGIPSPRGARWTATTVYSLGLNAVYCGTWIFGRHSQRATPEDPGGIAVAVPALITRDEWDAIRGAFAHRVFTRRGRTSDDAYLLRGRLTCGHCHGTLRTMTSNGFRYYACGCFRPSDARRLGKPSCDLPAVYALALEAELWRLLRATLLDPDALRLGLDAAQAQHAEGDRLRQERLAAHDAELARQRKRLDVLTSGLADAGDGEVYASILRQAKEVEQLIVRTNAERAELAAVRTEGLSATDADALIAFAEDVGAGFDHATPAERKRLYDLLQVRGTVAADPDGIKLGQRHHFRIDWQAAIPLRTSDNHFLKSLKTYQNQYWTKT